MTEAYEDEGLVRVRAQVMYRDEATGGWVALGAGGLSNVMVGKRAAPAASVSAAVPLLNNNTRAQNSDSSGEDSGPRAHAPCYEYFIRGKRITDQSVILSCTIKKDFQYNKVMPTFHHWVTDEKRFGLTFQTAADARAFDKGVRTAIQELLDGLGGAWPSLHAYKQNNPEPCDDDTTRIFESLILPSESRSSSENSTASRTQKKQEPPLANKELLMKQKISGSSSEEPEKTLYMDHIDADYSYVQLSAVHDYTYPQLGAGGDSVAGKPPLAKRDSGSIKKVSTTVFNPQAPPPLPDKKDLKPSKPEPFQCRVKCRHCHEWYLESANRAGACEFAPDCFRSCIDAVTCIKCAQCMLYHCMSDAEGEFVSHPCSCGPVDQACTKRWTGITLLSLLVPCLWCYPLLRCVHGAGRSCHVAGGRHAPFRPSLPPPRHP